MKKAANETTKTEILKFNKPEDLLKFVKVAFVQLMRRVPDKVQHS
jgi:hypothetical protein